MVLELARDGTLDGPVPRVVHPGRDLVGEQRALDVEELDRQHADVVEIVEQARRELLAARLERIVDGGGRRTAHPQDPVLVVVLDEGPAAHRAVDPAHRQHRQFAVEGHQRLQDERHIPASQLLPTPVEIIRNRKTDLALAVVPPAPSLEHRRQAHLFDGRVQGSEIVHRRVGGRADAEATEGLLLGEPILRHLERARPGPDRQVAREEARRVGGHALPLVGHHRRVARDFGERGLVAERADHEVAHGARRRAVDRVEEPEPHIEWDAGEREHAAELATSQHRHHLVGHRELSSAPTAFEKGDWVGVTVVGTAASLVVLVAVLALVAWGRIADVLVAGAAAVLVVLLGLVTVDEVGDVLDRLAPTLAFLAAVFVLAEVAREAGLFHAAGVWMGERGRTSRQLVVAISVVAVAVTVLMSLDATAVLFTPVVVQLVAQRGVRSDPPLLATTKLANASSSLLPISNLTNLLVFSATGLTFGGFALRMALPTLAASSVVVGAAVRSDRRTRLTPTPTEPVHLDAFAWFVVGAIAALTVAFFVGSALHSTPAWIAVGGAAVVAAVALATRRAGPNALVRAASPGFLVFVVGLAVVVQAAVDHGLGDAARDVLPSGDGLLALLGMAAVAAVLANLVNNMPATLVLASVVPSGSTALLLAMLLGVNVGPNLTCTGSLATLLWRRVVRAAGVEPSRGAFFRFAVLATPLALVLATLSLWLTLQVTG